MLLLLILTHRQIPGISHQGLGQRQCYRTGPHRCYSHCKAAGCCDHGHSDGCRRTLLYQRHGGRQVPARVFIHGIQGRDSAQCADHFGQGNGNGCGHGRGHCIVTSLRLF